MYSAISANKRRSLLLLFGFILLVTGLGWILSRLLQNDGVLVFMLAFALVYALIGYFSSAKLAVMASGARPIAKEEAPELYRAVENLAITAGLPMPKVYLIDDPAPNAFAAGRDPQNAVVAATTGLLAIMEKDELEGVIAHEMSHVGNYDIRFMSLVAVLAAVIAVLADILLRVAFSGGRSRSGGGPVLLVMGLAGAILAPLAASIVQLAISRQREYLADASGVMLTRYPDGLARALGKLAEYKRPMARTSTATAHMFISNPFGGENGRFGRFLGQLFATHPPLEDRISRLREMEGRV